MLFVMPFSLQVLPIKKKELFEQKKEKETTTR